jgi:hypothetical protein
MAASDSLDEVASELERVAERLDDLIGDALREAVRLGERSRPEIERRMTRARNAVLRARQLIVGADVEDLP